MKALSVSSTVFAMALAVHGVSTASTHLLALHDSLPRVPVGWTHERTPLPSERLSLRIAVIQEQPNLLDEILLDVSHPQSANYGKHWDRDSLKSALRPSAEATEAILSWLQSEGVEDHYIEDDGDWINFQVPVGLAEQMLEAKFSQYRNQFNGAQRIRTLNYSLPKHLHRHIDMVQPTTRFGEVHPQRNHIMHVSPPAGFNKTQCNKIITPACLIGLYNVQGYRAQPGLGDFMATANYLEQYAHYNDLEHFATKYAPYSSGKNFTWSSINGGLFDQEAKSDSIEANLDMQYALSIAYPVDLHAYSTAGRGPLISDLDQPTPLGSNEPYLDFFTHMLKLPDSQLPTTIATSYGENEQSLPEAYTRQVCNMIGQLGARGVSILFSSGDTGCGSACQTNDGRNTTRFNPTFPASCPYVTSVGGTKRMPVEEAIYFSSGGFSDRFPRPVWQEAAVTGYLDQIGDRWKGLYNPTGRGIPDVAAQSAQFRVMDKGTEVLVGGTSAAAPVFAAIVALLNNARLAAGLRPLGFLNPWLYSEGFKGLNDITKGGSSGCTGKDMYSGLPTPFIKDAGWDALKGWDAVTGLGTPDFQKLLDLVIPKEKQQGSNYGQGPWMAMPPLFGGRR